MLEKRRANRFPMALPLVLASSGAKASEPAQTRDVSSGGVYFEMNEAPEPGHRLEFVLTLPSEITLAGPVQIRCVGKVIRVDQGAGRQIGVAATIDRYEFLRPKEAEERTPPKRHN